MHPFRILFSLLALASFGSFTSCAAVPTPRRQPGNAPVPRTQLWEVTQACMAGTDLPNPSPLCVRVERSQGLEKGYLVLKDLKGASHFLVIPTTEVTGIEDPRLLRDETPDYWQAAWEARANVSLALNRKIPDHHFAFAANPPFARSQDQLHIHVDCVDPEVAAELKRQRAHISTKWSETPITLKGDEYRAMFVAGESLKGVEPFKLLARQLAPGDRMGLHTLVVVPAEPLEGEPRGFYLLEGHRAADDTKTRVHGEALMDLSCRIGD